MRERVLDDESVTGWVVETRGGLLVGPFESADEAAEWMAWEDDSRETDFDGKIRPITAPDYEDDEDEDEDCECGACSDEDEEDEQ